MLESFLIYVQGVALSFYRPIVSVKLYVLLTYVCKAAGFTVSFAGGAAGAAVKDAAVAEVIGLIGREKLSERKLYFFRVLFIDQSYAVGNADKVSVCYNSSRHFVDVSADKVCGLASHALKKCKVFYIIRYSAAETVKDLTGEDDKVTGFCAEETGGTDKVFHILDVCCSHFHRCRILGKQRGSNYVYTCICTLC